MDVSSTYGRFFEQRRSISLRQIWGLFQTVYKVGKLTELCSFALWESLHRTRLYPRQQYLTFTGEPAVVIDDNWLQSPYFNVPSIANEPVVVRHAAIQWKWVWQQENGVCIGCLLSDETALYTVQNGQTTPTRLASFATPITGLHVTRQGTIFVCSQGTLYRSIDAGRSFTHSLTLTTEASYFLFNNSMTELPDGRLLFGEYASIWAGNTWRNLAYLFSSDNSGVSWTRSDFLIQKGVNKHIHLIKYSSLLNAVVLTDGDNKKKIWINDTLTELNRPAESSKHGWRLVNRYHRQLGGYTAMAEGRQTVLLGTDYLGGTNFIVSTKDGRQFTKQIVPDPYRRSPIMNMVNRWTTTGIETWAILHNSIAETTRCLLMFTQDDGKTWIRVCEYDGTRYEIRLISSSHQAISALQLVVIAKTSGGERATTYLITS